MVAMLGFNITIFNFIICTKFKFFNFTLPFVYNKKKTFFFRYTYLLLVAKKILYFFLLYLPFIYSMAIRLFTMDEDILDYMSDTDSILNNTFDDTSTSSIIVPSTPLTAPLTALSTAPSTAPSMASSTAPLTTPSTAPSTASLTTLSTTSLNKNQSHTTKKLKLSTSKRKYNKTSWVWQYMIQEDKYDICQVPIMNIQNEEVCCGQQFLHDGSTGNMANHLREKHSLYEGMDKVIHKF